jgi:hypothetical protein
MRQFKPDVLQKIKDDDVLILEIAQFVGNKNGTPNLSTKRLMFL